MTPSSRSRTIVYLAGRETAARAGATALERALSGSDQTVQSLSTDAVDQLRSRAPEADCVVFAETPTTAAGATLLEVVDACGSTPLVLYADASYAPSAARSTDGIGGYVRRDTDDAVSHLADEIEWIWSGAERESETNLEAGNEREPNPENDPIAMPGKRASENRRTAARLLESVPELADCRDRERLFESLVETAADALECEYCWLSTVHSGGFAPRATAPNVPVDELDPLSRTDALGEAFRTGDPLRIDDLPADDRVDAPLEGIGSLYCVPVDDVGMLQVAAAGSNGVADADCDLLAAYCRFAGAILERIGLEASGRSERDRLRRERDQLRATRDRLADERDRLEAERGRLANGRDRIRALFANVPEPAVRYEIEDGRPVVRDVTETFTDVFGTDSESVVGTPVDETTVPPGLEQRRETLVESLRAGECRQLFSRRETVDGVREFRLALVPLEAEVGRATAADSSGTSAGGTEAGETTATDREHDGRDEDENTTDRNREGLILYSDVTDASRRERELAATEERLETIADLVDDEIRTPLNVARGYLELAEATGDAEHFREVADAQERLRELVDQLVSVARRDDVLVETEPVAIHDVARRAWAAVETDDARLVTASADDRVLEADKVRLRELFERLLQTVVEGEGEAEPGSSESRQTRASPIVTVGATDDGFYVARRNADTADGDGLETDPAPSRLAAADGTGFEVGTVERIADAHGWNVGVAEDGDRIAFAFRGIDSTNGADGRSALDG